MRGGDRYPETGISLIAGGGIRPVGKQPEAIPAQDLADLLEPLEQSRLEDEQPRPAESERVLERGSAKRGVQRREDGAEPRTAKPQLEHLDSVLRHQRNGITPADTGGGKRPGHRSGMVAELGVASDTGRAAEQRLVA